MYMKYSHLLIAPLVFLSACGSNFQAEAGFDQTLIEDPTLLVQAPGSDASFRVAEIEPGIRHNEFDSETIDQAIQDLFERGEGDDLYILKQALIPTAVWFGLEAGNGDPDAMIHTEWLGEIDGRIDTALNHTDYTPPETLSEVEIKRVIDTGLAPLIAKSVNIEPTDELTTAISKTVATYDYSIGAGNSDEEQYWINENAETMIQRYQLLKTLDDDNRLDLPRGLTVEDVMNDNGPELFDIPIIEEGGKPVVQNNETIYASDWDEELATFDASNNIVEKLE